MRALGQAEAEGRGKASVITNGLLAAWGTLGRGAEGGKRRLGTIQSSIAKGTPTQEEAGSPFAAL